MSDMASNGTPMGTLTDADWETPYGLGKFDTIAAEKLHMRTLDGWKFEETGNAVDWNWWAARFEGDADEPGMRAGAILTALSDGSTSAARYYTAGELDAAWERCEREYALFVHSECADGVDCDGCDSCENA